MKSNRTRLFSLLLVFCLVLTGFSAFAEAQEAEPVETAQSEETAQPEEMAQPSENFFANLELTYLDGTPFDASVFLGKPIFINIWATWCPPCLGEMPHLDELAKEYADKITIIGLHSEGLTVTQDGALVPDEEKNQLALQIAQEKKLSYPLVNPDQTLFVVMNNPDYGLQVAVLPTTWFVDGEGFIRRVEEGARDKDGWKAAIDEFLKFLEEEKNEPVEN